MAFFRANPFSLSLAVLLLVAPLSSGADAAEMPEVAQPCQGCEAPAMQSSAPQLLRYQFAGRWDHITTNTRSRLYLRPDGRYQGLYEARERGRYGTQGSYQAGAWGSVRAERASGHWTVDGNLERGSIILYGNNGRYSVLHYRLHGGEYLFNGKPYTANYIYR